MLSSFIAKSQENLLNLLGDDNEPMYISYLFKGTKVVNGQSVELPSKGVLQFTIQHRFGTLNSGFYNLYGLDNSQVRLGFDYGIKDYLSVGIGRSSAIKKIDMNSKLRIKRQIKEVFRTNNLYAPVGCFVVIVYKGYFDDGGLAPSVEIVMAVKSSNLLYGN